MITRAILSGIGLVDRPAYPQIPGRGPSPLTGLSERSGDTSRGERNSIAVVRTVAIRPMIEDAEFSETVIGVRGSYGEALGKHSKRGTLRVNPRKDGSGWDVEQDLPDTHASAGS